jgi:hypothetical protein
MAQVIKTTRVYINSAQRLDGTSSNFAINIPAMSLTSSKHRYRVRVRSATIPFTFKQLSASSSTFYMYYNATLFSVTITPANYNILTLLAELKNKIIAAQPFMTLATSYSRDTGFATLTLTGSMNPTDTLTFEYSSNPVINQMLGFTSNTTFSVGVPKSSTQHVNVSPVTSLYIRSDSLVQIAGNRECLLRQDENTDILAEVPVNVSSGSYIQFTNPSEGAVYLTNRTIDRIQMYLSDNTDFRLDLGGLDWTVTLAFDEVIIPQGETDVLVSSIKYDDPQEKARLADLEKEREAAILELEQQKASIIEQLYGPDK